MSSFTPGPWEISRADALDINTLGVREVKSYGMIICDINASAGRGEAIDKANALLIAAAPDLFSALDLIFDELDTHYDGEVKWMGLALESARFALKKAVGK